MLLKKYNRVNNFDKFVIIFYQNNEHFHINERTTERYDHRKSETGGGNGRDASGNGPSTKEDPLTGYSRRSETGGGNGRDASGNGPSTKEDALNGYSRRSETGV